MADITPPPGFTLDAPQATIKPPAGFTVDAPTPARESSSLLERIGQGIVGADRDIMNAVGNFASYPLRAIPADIYGGVKAAMAPSGKHAEEFWRGRGAVLGATELPEGAVGKGVSAVLNAPANLIGTGIGALSRATLGPEATSALAPYMTAAGDIAPFVGGGLIGSGVAKIADLAKSIKGNTSAGIDRFIDSAYQRAAKPSVTQGRTSPQMRQHLDQMRGALDSIIDNKANLQFTDPAGEMRTGELPRSLDEFGQAISQTKQRIFQQYDTIQQAAGRAGARVDLTPTVAELGGVTVDPVMKTLFPDVANYAANRGKALNAQGMFGLADAQRAIQHLNNSLSAFYADPKNKNLAGEVLVDSMIANKLREGLDNTINQAIGIPAWAVGPYQQLKNQYGNLRAIEREVMNRAIIEGRKELGGGILGRIGDVVSAREVVSGLMHMHPATVATGVGTKALTNWMAYRRSPNRAVEQIFRKAERQKAGIPPTRVSPMTGAAIAGAITPSRTTQPRSYLSSDWSAVR